MKALAVSALVLGLLTAPVLAVESDQQPLEQDNLEELTGIVTDRTITRIGHEFLESFARNRHYHFPDARENLTINERPSARWGSLIWITYNNRQIFETVMFPGAANIEEQAERALITVSRQLKRMQLEQLMSDTFDLDHDEL